MRLAIIKLSDRYFVAVTFATGTEEPPGNIVLTRRKFKRESDKRFYQRVRAAAEKRGIHHVIGLQ